MTSRHSANTTFEVHVEGSLHVGEFFTADDRLITVSAAGRRRTMKLGVRPPLALAESIAVDLLREEAAAKAAILSEHKDNRFRCVAIRLLNDAKNILLPHVRASA
jgi:hypothetical protein